jgi:hypothetical protein
MIRTAAFLLLLLYADADARMDVVHLKPDNIHAHPITVTLKVLPEGKRAYSVLVTLDKGYEPGDIRSWLRLTHDSREEIRTTLEKWGQGGVTFEFMLTDTEADRALFSVLVSHSSADARDAEAEGALLAVGYGTFYVVHVGEFPPTDEPASSTPARASPTLR